MSTTPAQLLAEQMALLDNLTNIRQLHLDVDKIQTRVQALENAVNMLLNARFCQCPPVVNSCQCKKDKHQSGMFEGPLKEGLRDQHHQGGSKGSGKLGGRKPGY